MRETAAATAKTGKQKYSQGTRRKQKSNRLQENHILTRTAD